MRVQVGFVSESWEQHSYHFGGKTIPLLRYLKWACRPYLELGEAHVAEVFWVVTVEYCCCVVDCRQHCPFAMLSFEVLWDIDDAD